MLKGAALVFSFLNPESCFFYRFFMSLFVLYWLTTLLHRILFINAGCVFGHKCAFVTFCTTTIDVFVVRFVFSFVCNHFSKACRTTANHLCFFFLFHFIIYIIVSPLTKLTLLCVRLTMLYIRNKIVFSVLYSNFFQ